MTFWDATCFMARFTCVGHKHHVLCTAWSPDGRRFASADKSGEVSLMLPSLAYVKAHAQTIPPSLSAHLQVRVWDPTTGKETCPPLVGHKSWVTSLAWEPLHQCGGNVGFVCDLLASSSKDKTVRVWSVRTGTLAFTLSGHADSIEAVRWGGENLVYTAGRDRIVNVWAIDAGRGAVLAPSVTFLSHSAAVAISPLCRPFSSKGCSHPVGPRPQGQCAVA